MKLDTLFDMLWSLYSKHNPQAQKIHQLLTAQGETITNDHIAFRTFQHPLIGIHSIAQLFLDRGYTLGDDYYFQKKKLNAIHLNPPDDTYPLVFLSELITSEFSPKLQETIDTLIHQATHPPSDPSFLWSQTQWEAISYATYLELLEESEYAAWTATFGFQANHFTILVNALKNFDLNSLNNFLKKHGFPLNDSGGEIKGSADTFLEQSSTLASEMSVHFSDCKQTIPCCYYEFAQRHHLPSGHLFKGFVTTSADKIFESTDNKQV